MPSSVDSPKLPRDALDLLRAFCDHEVRFLVVGAHALARVLSALESFGAPLFELAESDLVTPGVVFQMGVPPYRIDLNTEITGVPFEEAWADRVTASVAGLEIPFLSRAAMIRNKRAAGRPKDLLDLELLGEG